MYFIDPEFSPHYNETQKPLKGVYMKILAILGSPRKNGDNAVIMEHFIKGAGQSGHQVDICRVYDMEMKGCTACYACTRGKTDICIHQDDFNAVHGKIVEADCLVFSTPVYFGHMTGPLKTFIDRLYTFLNEDFTLKHLPGKKFITIVTSGAPESQFCDKVTEFFTTWFGEFMKMEHKGSIVAGNLNQEGSIKQRKEVLDKAYELGKNV